MSSRRLFITFTLIFILSACSKPLPVLQPTSTATLAPTIEPTATRTPEPTTTPAPPLALLLAPPGADQTLISAVQPQISEQAQKAGYQFRISPALDTANMPAGLRLVVALPPTNNLEQLVQAAPQVQFLAVGFTGIYEANNLSLIGASPIKPDQLGFMAGVIAAMITTEWRVGAVTLADSTEGKAAQQGFINGANFFCGLCRQVRPPFFRYPLYAELKTNADPAEAQAAVDYMVNHNVATVFIDPAASSAALLDGFNKAGIHMIGASYPGDAYQAHWVASLAPADPLPAFQKALPDLFAGKSSGAISLPMQIIDVNEELLSPGRQTLAARYLEDLLAGYIGTGVSQ